MTLQNAYGDREFPVRSRWRWRKIVAAARHRRKSPTDRALLFGLTLGAAAILLIGLWGFGTLTRSTFANFLRDGDVVGKFSALFLVIIVLALLMSWVMAFGDSGLPRREQRKYLRLADAQELTARQGEILALDAVSDFGASGWNRSLEYVPAWKAMPPSMQKKYEKANFRPFLTLELASVNTMRNHLDQSRSIASAADVERHVERALGEDSLSLKFVDLLSDLGSEEAVQRLASLTGVTEATLREMGDAPSGSPAPLLWAADVMLTIGFVRNAYVADYLEAERAWEHLERLAEVAFATFSGSEDYWANARIGAAFMTNSREALQSFDSDYRDLKLSGWPAARAEFPHSPTDQIPDVVRNLRVKSSLPE